MKTTAPLLTLVVIGVAGCSLDRATPAAAPPQPATAAAPTPSRAAPPTVRPTRRRSAPPATTAAGTSGTSAPPAAVDALAEPAAMPIADAVAVRQLAALPPAAFPAEPSRDPAVTPARLVGLDPAETTRLLGRPAETVEAPPALRWSWRAGSCTLRLFFFMDLKTRDFRALSYQTSGYDDANDADLRCLADVVAQAGSDDGR